MSRILSVLVAILIAVTGMIGYQYLSWVQNWKGAADPFDEIGIEIHSYMPAFVQDWGCAQLKAEFGTRTLPPYGCSTATDGAQWR